VYTITMRVLSGNRERLGAEKKMTMNAAISSVA
jgi:hypothetical protein